MPRKVPADDAVAEVVRLADAAPADTVWIGVDGRAGSGKTTFAARLAAVVPRVRVVHVDDFSGPREQTWDWRRFDQQVAAPLRGGRSARYQRWDWDRDEGAEWWDVEPGAVVVVEGVSALRSEVTVPWSLRIWVDAAREVRLRRALERDGPALMPRWLNEWMPSEEAYIAREEPRGRCDIVLDGSAHDVD